MWIGYGVGAEGKRGNRNRNSPSAASISPIAPRSTAWRCAIASMRWPKRWLAKDTSTMVLPPGSLPLCSHKVLEWGHGRETAQLKEAETKKKAREQGVTPPINVHESHVAVVGEVRADGCTISWRTCAHLHRAAELRDGSLLDRIALRLWLGLLQEHNVCAPCLRNCSKQGRKMEACARLRVES